MNKDKVIQILQQTIDNIDDYFEYQYRHKTPEDIANVVRVHLRTMNKNFGKLRAGQYEYKNKKKENEGTSRRTYSTDSPNY